jgi:hypothetical protein
MKLLLTGTADAVLRRILNRLAHEAQYTCMSRAYVFC